MSAGRGVRGIAGGAALLALFAFYLATRPLGGHVSDSYAWVNTVAQGAYGYFLHPHHLLYLPLAWRWNQLVQLIVPGLSVWTSLAAMSAAFGCAGAAAMYATLRLLGAKVMAAAAGAMLLSLSFGYWFFSSDPEIPVVSASCGLWTMYWLVRFATGRALSSVFWAGCAAAFAALLHQTGIFLFVPAAVTFWLLRRQGGFWRPMALFTVTFGAIVAPAYLVAAWAVLPDFGPVSFVRWIFLFAREGYGGWGIAQTPRAPIGFARGMVGGQMVLDWMRGVAASAPALWAGIALGCAGFVALGVFALKALTRMRGVSPEARIAMWAGCAAFCTYAVFAAYFDPLNFEWWTAPPAILTLTLAVPVLCGGRPAVVTAVIAAILVGSANYILDFSYRRRPDADFIRNAAADIVAMTNEADVIVAPSYLGVLIWHEAPSLQVLCPDREKHRINGQGTQAALTEMLSRASARNGRIVITGAEADPETRAFADAILKDVSAADRHVIGSIRFFTDRRGLVQKVSEIPVVAVDRQPVVAASGR